MNATNRFTIVVAGVVLLGGFAAVVGATPTDVPNADANEIGTTDDAAENDDDSGPALGVDGHVASESQKNGGDAVTHGVDTADAASEDLPGSVGPSDGLPDRVPEHVRAIHDRIESFLNGSIATLGESVTELRSSGGAGS